MTAPGTSPRRASAEFPDRLRLAAWSRSRRDLSVSDRARTGLGPRPDPDKREQFVASQGDPVIGHERCPTHLLALDLGAIGTDQIPDNQKSVRLDQHAMSLRQARVIDDDITIATSANNHDIACDRDWWIAVFWNEFGLHRSLVNTAVRPNWPVCSLLNSTSFLILSQAFTPEIRPGFHFLVLGNMRSFPGRANRDHQILRCCRS